MASRAGVIGWAAGVLSALLGALAFGAVLCLWFPAVLTTPALRDVYPMDLVRATIKWTLGVAFVLGVLSVLLKRRKALGLTGAGLATLATVMGGSQVAVTGPVARSNHVGLDWFLLDLFLLSAIFVPLELLFGRLREQPDLPARLADRSLALRREPPARAGDRAAHHGAGRAVLPLGDGPRDPGRRRAPAVRAPVRRESFSSPT